MKKFLSCLLAIVMVVAMLPAGVAFAAEGDIEFDFSTVTNSSGSLIGSAIPWPNWFKPTATYGRSPSTDNFDAKNWGVVQFTCLTTWKSEPTKDLGRVGFAIDVKANEAGWYTPEVVCGTYATGGIAAVYHIANGKATYLGDFDSRVEMPKKTLNAVQLSEGQNVIVFGFYEGASTAYIRFDTLTFKRLDNQEAPTPSSIVTDLPENMLSDGKYELTASLVMSDGVKFSFADYAVNTTNGQYAGTSTADRLEITSDNPNIFTVTDVAKGGAGYTDEYSFTVNGVAGGKANLVFTPYIGGVKQTPIKKEITITGEQGDIEFDFSTLAAGATANLSGSSIPWPDWFKPNGTYGQSPTSGNLVARTAGNFQVAFNPSWISAPDSGSGRIGFAVNVAANGAGWYAPKVVCTKYTDGDIAAVYHIDIADTENKKATYLGDFDFSVGDQEKRLNAVYLSEGQNVIVFGFYASNAGTSYVRFKKITFERLDDQETPTPSSIATDLPTEIDLGEEETLTASLTMSDGGKFSFADYAVDPNWGTYSNATNADRLEITSSNPEIFTVSDVAKGGAGATDEYSFKVTAKAYGSADVVFTPYIGGEAQTPFTKPVTVPHPNAAITGNNVSIGLTAIVDGVASADAKALLSGSSVAAGNVNSVKIGSTVTLKAEDSATLKFLYWYNGNSGRIISDEAEYTFTAGTNTPIFAKYARADGNLVEYFTAAVQLTDSVSGETETKNIGTYYTLIYEKVTAAVYDAVEKTAQAANFVAWVKDGEIVSYKDTYTYTPWTGSEVVAEVTEGEKSSVPAVVLFENNGAYMLELVNFDGVEIIEKGILFGGSLTIASCAEKAISVEDKNQFTASSEETKARAYVIYKDDATIRVAYSD